MGVDLSKYEGVLPPTGVSLAKVAQSVIQQLGMANQAAQVVNAFDYSGSMYGMNGNPNFYTTEGRDQSRMQHVADTVLAAGLVFDDDGEVPCYGFHNSAWKMGDLSADSYGTFIDEGEHPRGGTKYAPVLRMIIDDHFPNAWKPGEKKGLFGGRGDPVMTPQSCQDPIFVAFFTDGQPSDTKDTTDLIVQMAANLPIFIQFVVLGNNNVPYLEKLDDMTGRRFDNAGVSRFENVGEMDDDAALRELLNEFPEYVAAIQGSGLLTA